MRHRCYPPYGFVCPYTDNCPHLEGLSTTWVFSEFLRLNDVDHEDLMITDRFHAAIDERDIRIRALERENAELTAKLQALHRRQFKANKKKTTDKSVTSAADENTTPPKKKRGAPVGHPSWQRPKPKHIDRTVTVPAPTACPHCQSTDLKFIDETEEHIQEDIVIQPRPLVTRYVHKKAFCPRCRRQLLQTADDELLHAPIGPAAKSLATYLRYRIGISYRKVTDLFHDIFGLKFVPASAVGFDRKAAAKGHPLYADIREKIRQSSVVHGDETSWRNDGFGHFVWFAGNEHLAFFHIDRHRSASVAKAIFGNHFAGSLVRDRYAAYNGIGSDFQACLAHIITNAESISKEHGLLPILEQDAAVVSFSTNLISLCSKLCEIGQKLKSGVLDWNQAAGIELCYIEKLNQLCLHSFRFKPAENLRAALVGPNQKSFFTFLRRPGVPPTNNLAEQSLRSMVIFRKIFFGTRSERGLVTHSILPSLIQTARRQGVHPRRFLQTLLTTDTPTAQAALYKNSG